MASVDEHKQVSSWPRGSNGSLSFQAAGGSGGVLYTRARRLAHSWEVVATESHARIHRAMYPRQRAISRFAVQFDLKGYREYKQFFNFMKSYIDMYQTAQLQGMLVMSAVRNFTRWGVPIKGIADGDHTGSNLFQPTILFESINDPIDFRVYTIDQGNISREQMNGADGDQASFFYPFSSGSRDANVKAETLYDFTPGEQPGGGSGGFWGNVLGPIQDAAGQIGNSGSKPSSPISGVF